MNWWWKALAGALLAGWIGWVQAALSLAGGGAIHGVTQWVPQGDTDAFAIVQPILAQAPRTRLAGDGSPEFRVPAGRATWLAIDLGPLPQGGMLELTHPSLRQADLYLPGQAEPVRRGGRVVPVAERMHARYPVALPIPKSATAQTVYVRVYSVVAARGTVLINTPQPWETLSRLTIAGLVLGFGVAVGAALYALLRAVWLRSSAYAFYCLLSLAITATGMLITGLGEATVWAPVAEWRGQAASLIACVASGLALLLAERAFALEMSSPAFARALRLVGIACPVAGLLALPWPLPVQQLTSNLAAGAAIGLGLASIWKAWRTANPVAVWLLAGYTPVVLGVGVTTLAIAGVLPFTEWMLLLLPVSGMLEIPFNLHGLKLLEQRRATVRASRERLAGLAGPHEEDREEMVKRLGLPPPTDPPPPNPGATLLLLRFEGLSPGSPILRRLDEVNVERYLQHMMGAALRPGSQVGRWSFGQLLVRDMHHRSESEIDGLVTALFAASLRSERFGIPASDPRLRIAYIRVHSVELPVYQLSRQLAKALDDPQDKDLKKITLDPWVD